MVGESGCGKTAVALALVGLLPRNGRIAGGEDLARGQEPRQRRAGCAARGSRLPDRDGLPGFDDLARPPHADRQADRGGDDPAPRRVGPRRRARAWWTCSKRSAYPIVTRLRQYPHQLKRWGLRQRVAIAVALAAEIGRVDRRRADDRARRHDSGADPRSARARASAAWHGAAADHPRPRRRRERHRPRGRDVRRARRRVGIDRPDLRRPRHPYTLGLLESMPRVDSPLARRLPTIPGAPPSGYIEAPGCAFAPRCTFSIDACRAQATAPGTAARQCRDPRRRVFRRRPRRMSTTHGDHPLVAVDDLSVRFPVAARTWRWRPQMLTAVDGVSAEISRGESFALVGESGSGKTTLGRTLLGLYRPSRGYRALRRRRGVAPARRRTQALPLPHADDLPGPLRAAESPHEGRRDHRRAPARPRLPSGGAARRRRRDAGARRAAVRWSRTAFRMRSPEVSGSGSGSPARSPSDLSSSSLTSPSAPSTSRSGAGAEPAGRPARATGAHHRVHRAQPRRGEHIASRVAVMYLGQLVEVATRDEIFASPAHPYTRALLRAVPPPDPAPGGTDRPSRLRVTSRVRCPLHPAAGFTHAAPR